MSRTITNLDNRIDQTDLRSSNGIVDLADLMGHARDKGRGDQVEFGADVLMIESDDKDHFSEADFIFA